jgi:hypothetical protein
MSESTIAGERITTARPAARSRRPFADHSIAGIAIFGAASFMLFLMASFDRSPDGLWGPGTTAAIAWIAFAVHVAVSRRSLGAFDPAVWIPVVMLFHYFGTSVAVEVLDPERHPIYDFLGLGIPPMLNQGFILALLTFLSFLFGLQLGGLKPLGGPPPPAGPVDRRFVGAAWVLTIGSLLMAAAGIAILGPSMVFGSYHELKMAQKLASADTRFFFTGQMFATGGIMALLACHERDYPWRVRAAAVFAIGLALLKTFTGDRSGMSIIAFGCGWAFSQRVRRAPWWATIAGYTTMLFVIPMIGELREWRSIEYTKRMGAVSLFAQAWVDMGASVSVYCYTIANIPQHKSYDWGLSIVAAFVNNIPNVGLEPGRVFSLGGMEHNPGAWVTYVANPNKWEINKGGYANAIGAEWFFNFGMVGTFLGMVLTGFSMARVRTHSRDSPARLTTVCFFYAMLIGTVRNQLSYPLRIFLWPLVALWVLRWLWPRRAALPRARPRAVPEAGHRLLPPGAAAEPEPIRRSSDSTSSWNNT